MEQLETCTGPEKRLETVLGVGRLRRPLPAVWAVIVAAVVAACAREGSYSLHIVFADEQARQAISEVNLLVVGRGAHECMEWATGSLDPENLGILSRLALNLAPKEPQRLTRVPVGEVLFLAEGVNFGGARLLRGCTAATVKAGAYVEATLRIEWYCELNGDAEVPNNQRDDDCDGRTDECGEDAEEGAFDCDDRNVCTVDICADGVCHRTPYPDGLACLDMDRCTRRDACSRGTCSGTAKDCRVFSGQCRLGACDPQTGTCLADPVVDGQVCDDGMYCTTGDECSAGGCTGATRDCGDGNICTSDTCNEHENRCEHELNPRPGLEGPAGTPSCANGQDDDCDSLTDDADRNCLPCANDGDCDDDNACTADSCVGTACRSVAVADGTSCDDGHFCTVGNGCRGGVCAGAARDCSVFSSACTVGVCAEAEDRCLEEQVPDGTLCADGFFCTIADRCFSGTCAGGSPTIVMMTAPARRRAATRKKITATSCSRRSLARRRHAGWEPAQIWWTTTAMG